MNLLQKLAARINPVDAAWYDLADLVAERVALLLDKRGWTQRDLANELKKLGSKKKDSYISRLLAGGQNVTLRTLAELEVALGQPIITTPAQVHRDMEDGVNDFADTMGQLLVSCNINVGELSLYQEKRKAGWSTAQVYDFRTSHI